MPTNPLQSSYSKQARQYADDFAKGRIDLNAFKEAMDNNFYVESQAKEQMGTPPATPSGGPEPVPVVAIGPAPEPKPVPVVAIGPAPDSKPTSVKATPKTNMNYPFSGGIPVTFGGMPTAASPAIVKPAVKDKNGSAQKDSTSGIAAGMGASNPTGKQTASVSTPSAPASNRFQAYGPNFGYMGDKTLPTGYTGYTKKDGSYMVTDAQGNSTNYATEDAALSDLTPVEVTPIAPTENKPLTVSYSGAAQSFNPSDTSSSVSDANYAEAMGMNTPATEVGAPNGMGSIPTEKPQTKKAPLKMSSWRKRKGM
jgi:hypothetical protein